MATPLKPWERSKMTSSISPGGIGSNSSGNLDKESDKTTFKPAVPPRHNTGYVGYSSPYAPNNYYSPANAYSFGGYNTGYNTYSNYGVYNSPYNMYNGGMRFGSNMMNPEETALMRRAEERTRTAFQSVETVVGAFTSVAMMLESTYFAVQSCFRALLGVAQHFSRLKNHLWSIISAISILHRLKNWLRRLLALLRLRQYVASEELWDDITQSNLSNSNQHSSHRLWPVITFFTVIVGVPWLLWRLLSSAVAEGDNNSFESWPQGAAAKALFDFTAEKPDELTISKGDELSIAPTQLQPHVTGWILVGCNKRSGLVPSNYIEILSSGRSSAVPVRVSPPKPSLSPSED